MKSTLNMVWHIFKKDLKLLWPFVLGAAGIQFAAGAVLYLLDHHVGNAETLSTLLRLLSPATSLAAALLIATAVHQDAIPGVRQDWLVRPVRRKDLLLAKLLFILIMVQGPILLVDTTHALANGFPFGPSLASAATRGLLLLGFLSLPALAFSSLTRNLTEAVIGAVLLYVGLATLGQLIAIDPVYRWPTQETGLAWIAHLSLTAVLLVGATVIFTVQYFRRKTIFSRWVTVCVAFLAFSALFIPWRFAFALEERLSPVPGAGHPIVATYAPSLGKFRLPEGISHSTVKVVMGGGRYASRQARRDEASTVYLPMHIAGLADYAVLNADRAEVRLLAADGKLLYQGFGDDLQIRKAGRQAPVHFTIGTRSIGFTRDIATKDLSVPQDGDTWIYQGIALPRGLYERIKNQPLRLKLDYSLTLLKGDSYTMPALDGDQRIPGVGRCTTKMDDDGDDIDLRCIQAGRAPFCMSGLLEHVPSGRTNPMIFACLPNYAPYLEQLDPDGMVRFGAGLRFHDLSGLAKYPVDASQLPESHVVLRVYQAQDHFTRQLVIPEIRLSDWESVER